ncbi:hypothetical protein BDZ89DRAFT_1075629 [Hymenopellis radicata]|nr:hypothetical protein BDZ89DRAFT_1076789 [Hymenopellis radicata]KAF9016460.1 hypothetical protein BDZ89DRAFT_1075629 [Hymenopellis radicata]
MLWRRKFSSRCSFIMHLVPALSLYTLSDSSADGYWTLWFRRYRKNCDTLPASTSDIHFAVHPIEYYFPTCSARPLCATYNSRVLLMITSNDFIEVRFNTMSRLLGTSAGRKMPPCALRLISSQYHLAHAHGVALSLDDESRSVAVFIYGALVAE